MLGEDLIGLLGSAFEGDLEAGAADFDLEGLCLGDSGLAGVYFSGAYDLLVDLPRGSMSRVGLAAAGFCLVVVVLADFF